VPKGQFLYTKDQRDRLILAAMRQGKTNPQIARALGLTPNTIRAYVQQILTDLGAHTRTEAVMLAIEAGILPAPRTGQKRAAG